ncbi:mRNA-decapping enzyme 1B-like protein [Leptotrombidium deliense]|uniref:mRNA-decapping enzyme 1B-like protein n=1 Tax=Leptotrombidium deliense TaxID=299467 RepID=A0A443SUC2_9ACAR|nr:mRNA-decapping enzyme 1B-like protein [Leptotrombidium deliense]
MSFNGSSCKGATNNCKFDLNAIQCVDKSVVYIYECVSSVAVYRFDLFAGEYKHKEIEGSVVIVGHEQQPIYSLLFMNSSNKFHRSEAITERMLISVQSPFLMYKNECNEIFCIWFRNEYECKRIAYRLKSLISMFTRNDKFVRNYEYKVRQFEKTANYGQSYPKRYRSKQFYGNRNLLNQNDQTY